MVHPMRILVTCVCMHWVLRAWQLFLCPNLGMGLRHSTGLPRLCQKHVIKVVQTEASLPSPLEGPLVRQPWLCRSLRSGPFHHQQVRW